MDGANQLFMLELPKITVYINQYIKLKMCIFLNRIFFVKFSDSTTQIFLVQNTALHPAKKVFEHLR